MDTARYVVGVLLLVALPPCVLLWFAIHPFVQYWRRLGAFWTYVVLSPMVVLIMLVSFVSRQFLLGSDLGMHAWLLVPAAVCLVSGVIVTVKRRRHLNNRVVAGLPELSPQKHETRLITAGIYSRIRHPRYLEILLFTSAYAFFSNHAGVYVAVVLCVPAFYLVVVFEERELRDRFGAEYEVYCQRVPRFFPVRESGGGG